MSTEYPLDPFTDFATKVDFELEEPEDGPKGWGLLKPERRDAPVPPSGPYTGVGEDNPYGSA